MKTNLNCWRDFICKAKESAKSKGKISGDSDIAAAVTEILEENNFPKVERGAINHWLKGVRNPSIQQFIAICIALNVSPKDAFNNLTKEDSSIEAVPLRKQA